MGFGILFIGYALAFGSAFFTTYLFADIIGCLVMIAGLVTLMQYDRSFKYSAMAAGVLTMIYAAAAAMRMMGYSGNVSGEVPLMGEQIYLWVQYAISTVAVIFDLLLLMSIARLSRDVELPEIAKRCRIWVAVLGVYFALWLFFSTLQDRILAASLRVYNVLGSGLNLFHALWLVMMISILMSCMKWIAPADAVEAEENGDTNGDGFFTRLGAKLIELEEKARVPREKKEEERLKRDLERNINSDNKNGEE